MTCIRCGEQANKSGWTVPSVKPSTFTYKRYTCTNDNCCFTWIDYGQRLDCAATAEKRSSDDSD